MTMRRALVGVILAAAFLQTTKALAQESALGGTIGLSSRPAGNDDSPYLYPGFGGTGVAGVVCVDVGLTPRLSVGGEISLAAAITASQSQRGPGGSYQLETRHSDTIFLGTLKFTPAASGRTSVAAVAGAGVARRHTERSGPLIGFTPGLPPITSKDEELTDGVLTFGGGADVAVAVGERVDVLVLGRVYVLATNDRAPDGTVARGVSNFIVRFGAGARIRF